MPLDDAGKQELARCLVQLQANAHETQRCLEVLSNLVMGLVEEQDAAKEQPPPS